MDRFAEQLREPISLLLREEAAYGKLIDALDCGSVFPDRDLCNTLAGLAEAVDRENEYPRVLAEHEALSGLLGQVEGALA